MAINSARLHRRLLTVCVGALGVLLLAPPTRDLESLGTRLLLRLPGHVVRSDAHRLGELGLFRFEWSPAFTESVRKTTPTTPDEYLVAKEVLRGAYVPRPAVEAWRGSPLATWMALRSAALVNAPQSGGFDRAWVDAMLSDAARREPANGAIWAAQALVAQQAGNLVEMQAALHEALQRPRWDLHVTEAGNHLQALFDRAGLPDLEARWAIRGFMSSRLISEVTTRLAPTLTEAEAGALKSSAHEASAPDAGRDAWARDVRGESIWVLVLELAQQLSLALSLVLVLVSLPFTFAPGSLAPWRDRRFVLASMVSIPLALWVGAQVTGPATVMAWDVPLAAAGVAVVAIFLLQVIPWRYRLRPLSFAAVVAIAHLGITLAAVMVRADVLAQLRAHAGF